MAANLDPAMTIPELLAKKKQKKKISALTAYDFPMAQLLDACGLDIILVGDSLGNVVLGLENTIPVTMAQMLHHCAAVSRGVKNALLVADMPFGSYHVNIEEGVRNAARFLKEGGAQAVKIEGGLRAAAVAEACVDAQIPVMGHIGLTPQSLYQFGGYRVTGKEKCEADALIEDAKALEDAGCFAIVLELVQPSIAGQITEELQIPTIGIGSGILCDGQILVTNDLLGFGRNIPKHVVPQADLNGVITDAVHAWLRSLD